MENDEKKTLDFCYMQKKHLILLHIFTVVGAILPILAVTAFGWYMADTDYANANTQKFLLILLASTVVLMTLGMIIGYRTGLKCHAQGKAEIFMDDHAVFFCGNTVVTMERDAYDIEFKEKYVRNKPDWPYCIIKTKKRKYRLYAVPIGSGRHFDDSVIKAALAVMYDVAPAPHKK